MNRVNNDNTSSERGKWRVCAAGILLAGLLLPGCKTLNESPQNERFWFPTLAPPTQKEREMRSYNYPEGGDPFVGAEVGPKTLLCSFAALRRETSSFHGVFYFAYLFLSASLAQPACEVFF